MLKLHIPKDSPTIFLELTIYGFCSPENVSKQVNVACRYVLKGTPTYLYGNFWDFTHISTPKISIVERKVLETLEIGGRFLKGVENLY